MKKHILFILLLAQAHLLAAQHIVVREQSSGERVAGLSVTFYPGPTHLVALNGEFDIPEGADSARLVAFGYYGMTINLRNITQNTTVYMREMSVSLGEVVVSASRSEEDADEIPRQIRVLTTAEIRAAQQPSTAHLLETSGAVSIQRTQGGGGSPIMRGFEANRILLMVDGVRMNNAIYRSGHIQSIITVDPNILSRVDMIFGPGTVVYGSDALGGVIHMFTKTPTFSHDKKPNVNGAAFYRYGSAANESQTHANLLVGGRKLAWMGAFTYSSFGDLTMGRNRNVFLPDFGKRDIYQARHEGRDTFYQNPDPSRQIGSGYTQYDAISKLVYRQGENTQHALNLQFSNSSDIPRYDRLNIVRNGQPRFAEWYYGPQQRFLASYKLEVKNHLLSDNTSIIAAYQNVQESRYDRLFQREWLNANEDQVDILSLNVDAEKRLGKFELRYGGEFYYNYVTSIGYEQNINSNELRKAPSRYADGGSAMTWAAAYVQSAWEIDSFNILNAGVRQSHTMLRSVFSDTSLFTHALDNIGQRNSATTGQLGYVRRFRGGYRVGLSASSGFKAPNVDDVTKVFERIGDTLTMPNPNLAPEYTYNGEVLVGRHVLERYKIEASVFYTLYRNALTIGPGTWQGQEHVDWRGRSYRVFTMQNAGRAFLYGYAVAAGADITRRLSAFGTINWTYARIDTSETLVPLDHIAPLYGRLGITWRNEDVRADFYTLFNGPKRLEDYSIVGSDNVQYAPPQGLPGWYTLNARVSWTPTNHLMLTGGVENILDTNYRTFASGISAAGRNIQVSARVNF